MPVCAIETSLASLSQSTIVQYGVTYKLWWIYCNKINICPYQGDVNHVLDFLQSILNNTSNSYGTFNSHRSALSLILPNISGENADIKRFLKGVFKLRPSKPRYNFCWDPLPVLNFLEKMDESSLESLSHKLVTLLALASGHRLQTIAIIKLPYLEFYEEGVRIFIPDHLKTSGPRTRQPCLTFPVFTDKPGLCVVSTLKKYLEDTKAIRPHNQDELFITIKKPHKVASKQSLSRWLKNTLRLAGVDTTQFKAHSVRHASTSAAHRNGISIDTIREAAGWSKSSSVFARFYNRPIHRSDSYAKTILGICN